MADDSRRRINEQLEGIQNDIRTSRPAPVRLKQLQKRQTQCIKFRDEKQVALADANAGLAKTM